MALMDSVGIKGTVANYRLNYSMVKHLYRQYYHSNAGIRDLSNKFVEQRRELFAAYEFLWDKSEW